MQDGAVKDEESIKYSDVLVEDPEEIEKHAKKLEKIFRQNIETEARVIENAFGWSDWRSR